MWPTLAFIVLIMGLAYKRKSDRSLPSGNGHPQSSGVQPMGYTLESWGPIVSKFIASKYPSQDYGVIMKWMEKESGGNPYAIGTPGATASDGSNNYPREIGLGQLYNIDDFAREGITPGKLRDGYCLPNDQMANLAAKYWDAVNAKDYPTASRVMSQLQTGTRPLTPQEMNDQVEYTLMKLVGHCQARIDHDIIPANGLNWGVGADYWKLVKAVHAWPAKLLDQGMPAVVKKLGRAPSNWAEYRNTLGMDGNKEWNSILNLCEVVGNAYQGKSVG